MKKMSLKATRPGPSRVESCAKGMGATFVAALLAGAPSMAGLGGNHDVPPNLDEDVGTMPLVLGDFGPHGWQIQGSQTIGFGGLQNGSDSTVSTFQPAGAALAVSGHADLVRMAVDAYQGTGFIVLELLGGDRIRVSFHGDVDLALDQRFLTAGLVDVELLVPAEFAPAYAAAAWRGGHSAVVQLPSDGSVQVPVAGLASLATSGPVSLQAQVPGGESYRLGLWKRSGRMLLQQTHQ